MEASTTAPPPFRPRRPVHLSLRERLERLVRRVFRLALFIVTVALIIDAFFGDKGLFRTIRVRREYQDLSASIERLRRENARLRDEARRLRTDPAAVEEVARRELGLIKPGELVFIVKDARPRADLERPERSRPRP